MKTNTLVRLTALLSLLGGIVTAAPLGTAFTYQGRLASGSSAANGLYDFQFTIYDALADGNAIAGPLTNAATGVTNGLFTVALDFGASPFTGAARWLEIGVRASGGGGAFSTLSPRQPLTAAPYATWASGAATAQTAAVAKDLSGPLSSDRLTGTYTSKITFFNGTNEFYGDVYGDTYGDHFGDSFGDFYGDGYGITHLNASQLWYGTMPDGRLSTNVAMLPANQVFSGSNLFTGALVATNASNVFQGTFAGNGAAISNLNGVALTPGTVGNTALQTNAVTADKVASGQVVKSLNNLKDDVVLAAGENIFLATNGNSLQVSAMPVATAWRLTGNPSTDASTNFIGTTDNQPLELRVNGMRALRLEPIAGGALNLIGGSPSNSVILGSVGATIGGGYNNAILVAAAESTIAGGLGNSAIGNYTTVGGGYSNITAGVAATIAGGFRNSASNANATVAGGYRNNASGFAAAIGGGWRNTASGDSSTVAGGTNNTIQSPARPSAIAGGEGNTIQTYADYSAVGGGLSNNIQFSAYLTTIAGGDQNAIMTNSDHGFIGGGGGNIISNNASYSTIAGGQNNSAGAALATVGGGQNNTILAIAYDSTIGGGQNNTIQTAAGHSTIGGGEGNSMQPYADHSTIGGGEGNSIQQYADHSTIGGGEQNTIQNYAGHSSLVGGSGNTIQSYADYSFIGGGIQNLIQANANYSSIGSGQNNTIQSYRSAISSGTYNSIKYGANSSFIGSGNGNTVQTNAYYSFIGSGYGNTIQTNAYYSFLGGGYANTIQTNSHHSTIGGGEQITIQANSQYSTIGGGSQITIQTNSGYSTIGGGMVVIIGSNSWCSTICGGYANWIYSNAPMATIAGGSDNRAAGGHSFAAGYQAQAMHEGSFVWSDTSSGNPFSSTAAYQFNIRSAGGVRIATTLSGAVGVQLTAGATSWTSLSDRNAKKNFRPVDTVAVLDKLAAIPVEQWNYNWEQDSDVPNLGPMAQDFKAAFYPGRDDKGISTLEFDGVELAAIQGLNQKLERKEAEITELKRRLERLEQLVTAKNGGAQ